MRRLWVGTVSLAVLVGSLTAIPAQAVSAPAPGPAPSSIQTPTVPPAPAPARARSALAPMVTQLAAPGGVAYATGDVFAGLDNATVGEFSAGGSLRQSLATGGGGEQTGMCFDGAGNLYTTNFSSRNMTKFGNTGGSLLAPWTSAFTGEPESCVVDNHGNIWVGAADSAELREFDPAGNLLGVHQLAREDRGIDWIDLSGDQCTFLYTSEGSSVKAFNACNDTQLVDFAAGWLGRVSHCGSCTTGGSRSPARARSCC